MAKGGLRVAPLMSAEFVHGLWRMKVLGLWLEDFPARHVCVLTGAVLILLITYVCIPWIPRRRQEAAWCGISLAGTDARL